jgi:membrane-bound lytic murein transglycosylase C
MDGDKMKKKMKRVLPFVFCIGLIFSLASNVSSDEFEDMMQQEMNAYNSEVTEFQAYRQQILNEFEAYKKITEEEYDNYRKEILNYWDKPELSTKKEYVQYSPDMKTKKKVDFENEKIEVEVIVPKGSPPDFIDKKLKNTITDLITENQKTAWEKDKVSQKIETRLKTVSNNIKTSKISNDPIITKIVTDKVKPDETTIKKTAQTLFNQSKVTSKPSAKVDNSVVVTLKIDLPKGSMKKNAENYVGDVKQYSSKNKISPSLVMAVMQTESAFNPMARSYVPAYGLMQIVPKSAGLDASKEVLGKEVLLSPSFLYNSTNNIKMGTAYINILYFRYLKKIENKTSRLYCTIAAYNTGAGNVARAFTGKTNISVAAKTINKLSPEQVYQKLLRNLPHDETRNYLKNVNERRTNYKAL